MIFSNSFQILLQYVIPSQCLTRFFYMNLRQRVAESRRVVCERESLTHFVTKLPQYDIQNSTIVSAMVFHRKHFVEICLNLSQVCHNVARYSSIGIDFAYISCNSSTLLPSFCCISATILTESVIE